MTCLKELDLSRCVKVTDAGMKHLLSISTLEKLWLSETGLTADGIALLSSLQNLSVLDLGGLPVTDLVLRSLQVLSVIYDYVFCKGRTDIKVSTVRVYNNGLAPRKFTYLKCNTPDV